MITDKTHRQFFDHQAHCWNSADTRQKVESLEKIFQQINLGMQEMVLDVGCGTGILVPVLLKYLEKKGKIIEFDFSLEMLKQNRIQCQLDKPHLIRLNGDTHHLPFASQWFTFLACFAVLPHLSRPGQAFHEWFRVLRRGGKLLILHLMSNQLLNRFHSQADEEIQYDYLPPAERVAEQIKKEGFQILQVQERENLYLILAQK